MNILKPLIKLSGHIYLSRKPFFCMYKPKFHKLKGNEIRTILNTLKNGDILLRRYHGYLNTILTPGYWGHAALYVGRNKVIHALNQGVVKEDILDFCRCDDFALVRVRDASREDTKEAISKANQMEKEGFKYDYEFESDDGEVYCTEMIDVAYGNIFDKDYESKWGKNVILPDKMYDSRRVEKVLAFKHK